MPAFDPRTALIVVDVQNDFVDPKGSLAVAGAPELLEFINQIVEFASEGGATVAYTRDWHPPDTSHFEKDGGVWPVHCVAGTWGAEFYPALDVVDGAIIIDKGTGGEDGYSGFAVRDPETGAESPTGLEATLRERGIGVAVVVGVATDYCVKATAIDAANLGLTPTVLLRGIAAVDLEPGDGDRAIAEMRDAGALVE